MAANAPRQGQTPLSLSSWPSVTGMFTGAWTVVNKAFGELDPKWSLVFGLVGSLLVLALSDNLKSPTEAWKRWVIYGVLFALNTVLLAGAAIGVEEVADQGLDKAADD